MQRSIDYEELQQEVGPQPGDRSARKRLTNKWVALGMIVVFCVVVIASSLHREKRGSSASKPESKTWKARSQAVQYQALNYAGAHHDLIEVSHKDGVDVWEAKGEDFVLKHHCKVENVEGIQYGTVVPNLRAFVYVMKATNKTIHILDMKTCTAKPDRTIDVAITGLTSGIDELLISVSEGPDQLYKSHGESVHKWSINAAYYAAMSTSGLVAFRAETDKQRVNFFAPENKTTPASIPIGFEFSKLFLTPSGSRVVIQEDNEEHFVIYDIKSQKNLFRGTCLGYGPLKAISDDASNIVFFDRNEANGAETVTVITMNLDGKHVESDAIFTPIKVTKIFKNSLEFRKVNGNEHLHMVSKSGVLSVYKLDKTTRKWELLV